MGDIPHAPPPPPGPADGDDGRAHDGGPTSDGGPASDGGSGGDAHVDRLLLGAATSTRAHVCVLFVLAEDGRVLMMDAESGLPEPFSRSWVLIRSTDQSPVAVAVRQRRLVWVPDREAMAREFPLVALAFPYGFALAVAPLVDRDGEVRGAMMLLWPPAPARRPTRHQLDVLTATCADLAEIVPKGNRPVPPGHQPRVLTRQPPGDDDLLLTCLNRLPEGYCMLDVEGRLTLVTAPAEELLQAEAGELTGKRPWDALPWLGEPAYEDRYRAAVVSQEVTYFTTRNPGGQWLAFHLYPGLAGVTMRVTPSTMARDPRPVMPDQLVAADRPPRLVALHEMLHLATTLARAVTAQEVINLVADHVMPAYHVQALAILTSRGGRMQVAASRGYSEKAIEEYDGQPLLHLPPGHPLAAGAPAFFGTWAELRATYPEAIRSDDMSAWAFLPLTAGGRTAGMCILAYDRPHRFTTDERASLTALSGLIAQAFERARLYDVKHQFAQSLQSSLLPRTLPGVPGLEVVARYLPATPGMDIGGDFYDLIRLEEKVAAAVIGDVQGHDVTAAALMGQVRTAIHAHASAGANPGKVLAHTNRLLNELAPDRFTSCLYISVDLGRSTACVASAGHLPALLRRPGEPAQVVEPAPGLLLGIEPGTEYATTQLALPPGSVLALYTDGLIEVPGQDLGEAIGRLAARFAPAPDQPLADVAEDMIAAAAAVEHRADDIAMLLLRTGPA
ncbi:SpoIIE family protein phosphatase [Nonomuraea sp. NPDC049637]|uniref:SpoIIE family protein phosphatase n=1 Tax=Nonomuraea sp. NPDC049637 TaxID=3154356 RepID=UPI00341A2AA3